MITAEEREKGFREALKALLDRHGAALTITDVGGVFGYGRPVAEIWMPSIYDANGELVAHYAEFTI